MAAPLFTQHEIERLIALPKHALRDEWEGRWAVRHGTDTNVRIVAHPDDPDESMEFHIERQDRPSREEVSVRLSVKMPGRGRVQLCRYDIQVSRHTNRKKWFTPRYVSARAPHKHVYNVRAVKEGTPSDWDVCAIPLDIGGAGSQQQLVERLLRVFIDDIALSFYDSPAQQQMFRR